MENILSKIDISNLLKKYKIDCPTMGDKMFFSWFKLLDERIKEISKPLYTAKCIEDVFNNNYIALDILNAHQEAIYINYWFEHDYYNDCLKVHVYYKQYKLKDYYSNSSYYVKYKTLLQKIKDDENMMLERLIKLRYVF